MTLIIASLTVAIIFLIGLVWYRFDAESSLAKGIYGLSDKDKHYISMIMKQPRIELSDQPKEDRELLKRLVDDWWLFPLADGVLLIGEKTEYLAKNLTR